MLVADALIENVFQIPLGASTNILVKEIPRALMPLRFEFWCCLMKNAKNLTTLWQAERKKEYLFGPIKFTNWIN